MENIYRFINNLTQESKDSMLIDGLARGNGDIVKMALLMGANPLVGGPKMRCWAAKYGKDDILRKFIEEGKWDVVRHNLPIKIAAAYGQLSTVKLLLKEGANASHAIIDAAENGKTEVVRYLLESGAKLHKDTEVVNAARNGYADTVKLLLDYGANPSGALPLAIIYDHAKVVEVLIKNGAEIFKTAVIMAVQHMSLEVLPVMLRNIKDLDNFTICYIKDLLPWHKEIHQILEERFGEK